MHFPARNGKTWQNAVFKLQWSKTQFLRKSCIQSGNLMQIFFNSWRESLYLRVALYYPLCISWLDFMQNAFISKKWKKLCKTLLSSHNKEKNSCVLMSGFNTKTFFQREMMKIWENPFFNKEKKQGRVLFHKWIWWKNHLFAKIGENLAKCGFETTMVQNTVFKRVVFHQEISCKIKNSENFLKCCFQPKIRQNTLFNKEFFSIMDLHFLTRISKTLTKWCFQPVS